MINKKNNLREFAFVQIILLVGSIFAIGWMLGSSIGTVSAGEGDICSSNGEKGTCIVEGSPCGGTSADTCNEGLVCCIEPQEDKSVNGGKAALGVAGIAGSKLADKAVGSLIFPQKAAEAKATGEIIAGTASKTALATTPGVAGAGASTLGTIETSTFPAILGGQAGPLGSLGITAAWAAVAYFAGRFLIGPALGLSKDQSAGLGTSLGAGTFAGLGAANLLAVGGVASLGIGLGVALVVSLFTIKKSSIDIINYGCYVWDAPLKGENCELCNQQGIECTEYQCRSLGQGCEFSIDSISGQALCNWDNSKDILPPQISPRIDSLISSDYGYSPDGALSPPDTGVKVNYKLSGDTCAPPWTKVSFGLELDERARCKFSPGIIYDSYDEMPDLFLSKGLRLYNHTYSLSLPSTSALESENVTVENGGIYNFYVRCQDSNGNQNKGNFGFNFCVDQGPDTVAPLIDHTSPVNNAPFASGQNEFNVDLYVNEPAECRWSNVDKAYDSMENVFSCNTNAFESNSQNLFRCTGALDGLKDNQDNNFYFRCRDQPHLAGTEKENLRNTNEQSHTFTLVGTQELRIVSAKPNNTVIKDSTSRIQTEIEVETALGYDDGKAICSLSETGEEGSYVNFFYGQGAEPYSTNNHIQTLTLPAGDYEYTLRCSDQGGNTDTTSISFSVETDTSAPNVVRVYREGQNLKIITDEEAQCVYGNTDKNYDFDDGIKMTTFNGIEHLTGWDGDKTFYIKCEDQYGKRTSSEDTTVIRPFNL